MKSAGSGGTSFESTVISTEKQSRLIIPVTVRKQIMGYCTFLYIEGENNYQENDFLILERASNAVSLFLLNEKTSFEAFEKMKGNFLEQLLIKQYASRKEILKRGTYVNIDLAKPFHIIVLGYFNEKINNMNDEYALHKQILDTALLYFREQNRNVLIGQRDGNLVFLVNKEAVQDKDLVELFTNFLKLLEKSFKKCKFRIVISTEGKQIEAASQNYDEAILALRMATTKKILAFEDLGVVGALINSSNQNIVKSMAKQLLGALYDDKPQNVRLIKTLYVFLTNGGRLEQTMRDLELSMSGLLYRIKKIESAIQKDLRNPEDSYQLYLLLDALIALGELKIE